MNYRVIGWQNREVWNTGGNTLADEKRAIEICRTLISEGTKMGRFNQHTVVIGHNNHQVYPR